MRVFVSNVDTAVGHSLSRLFAQSPVTNRQEADAEAEEGAADTAPAANNGEENDSDSPEEQAEVESYIVHGTLTPTPKPRPTEHVNKPGLMAYTGDRKRDAARKEAIEKYAVNQVKPDWVESIVELKEKLLETDIIVYDLANNLEEAVWAAETLAEIAETFQKPKTFILISTVMTWARTKVDPEDPEASLTEDEYRRRKPHPNFKSHSAAEKSVMKAGKKAGLKTFIVASGLTYHSGNSIFHYLLKDAWHNTPELVCYGDGNNVLPTIHLDDLVNIVFELAETAPSENRYVLAVDDSKNTLLEITKAVSEALSTGKIAKTTKEAALLHRSMTQTDYDMILLNARLDPGHVKEMTFEWKCDSGIIESLPYLIQEYKDSRGLLPLKIIIHGPPASGKSTLARKIANHYGIHLVDVEGVVEETMARLERNALAAASSEETEESNDDNADLEADKELWDEVQEAIASLPSANPAKNADGGENQDAPPLWTRVPQDYIITFIGQKLRSMPCRNQGYVLDGFPPSYELASTLFKNQSDEETNGIQIDPIIGPEFVISLKLSDEVIKERGMSMPEGVVAGTRYAEDQLLKRLEEFRTANHDENTVLNYYDENDVHPMEIDIAAQLEAAEIEPSSSLEPAIERVLRMAVEKIGLPRNYGPTFEQLAELKRKKEEQTLLEAAIAEEERVRKEREEVERHNKSVQEWNSRLEEVRKQEQEVLEAQSVPLRNYLMKHVMPTLTAGLIDVCKVRPDDPVDYLSEFLFKQNPTNYENSAALETKE